MVPVCTGIFPNFTKGFIFIMFALRVLRETFMIQLREKLATTDIERAKEDVIGFVDNPHELDIWSNDYFLQLADKIVWLE